MSIVRPNRTPMVVALIAVLAAASAVMLLISGEPSAHDGTAPSEPPPSPTTPALAQPTSPPSARRTRPPKAADIARQLRRQTDACVARMHARAPHAQGLLSVQVHLVPGGESEAVVDDLAPGPQNEIEDPELFDCLAEGAFVLPAGSGPLDHELTLMVEPHGH